MHDKLLHLSQRDFSTTCVRSKPLIHQGRSILKEELWQVRGLLDTISNVLIRGLWEIQTGAIIDVRFGDADVYTYKYEPVDNLLDHLDKRKRVIMANIVMSNRYIFLHFPYQFVACSVGKI